jgi:Uma2 family endonuclease
MASAAPPVDRCELIDGCEVVKPLAKKLHFLAQSYLAFALRRDLPARFVCGAELSILCGANRIAPDVVVTTRQARFVDGCLADPPLLAVEILSPGLTIPGLFHKAQRLIDSGAPQVWIILPERRQAWSMRSQEIAKMAIYLSADFPSCGEGRIDLRLYLPDLWEDIEQIK